METPYMANWMNFLDGNMESNVQEGLSRLSELYNS